MRYNIYIVVNGTDWQIQTTEDITTLEVANEQMSILKEVENISLELVNGDILSINGVHYKDVYFKAVRSYDND